jgi:ketosteroid isomerase-like protein
MRSTALENSSHGAAGRVPAFVGRGALGKAAGLLVLVGAILSLPAACAAQDCRPHVTPNQRRDAETIRRVEHDWARAVMTGDVDYVRCLLTDDYQSVGWKGVARNKEWVLNLTRGNAGKQGEPQNNEATTLFHGDAALRYADVTFTDKGGNDLTVRFTDFFVWEKGRWRAYYTQDTKLETGVPK